MTRETQVTWHPTLVSRQDRERLGGHSGCVVWFTGLSGCGKSTIANLVDRQLYQRGVHSFVLDGDNIRHGLNASTAMLQEEYGQEFANRFGLAFGPLDRQENIRRIGSVARLFCSAGLITLTAFVSPYRRDRDAVRKQVVSQGRADDFIEVFVNAPLSVCEARDPKGLYRQARAGAIHQFTGIDDPYEPPLHPELVLDSAQKPAEELANEVVAHLESRRKLARS